MLSKIWGTLLLFAGLFWIVDAVRLFFGLDPSLLRVSFSFLVTGFLAIKWSFEELSDEK